MGFIRSTYPPRPTSPPKKEEVKERTDDPPTRISKREWWCGTELHLRIMLDNCTSSTFFFGGGEQRAYTRACGGECVCVGEGDMGRRKDNDRMFFSVTVCSCVQERKKKKSDSLPSLFALLHPSQKQNHSTSRLCLFALNFCNHTATRTSHSKIFIITIFFFSFFFYFLIYMQQQQLTFSDSAFNLFPLPPAISTAWYSCLGTPVVMFEEYYYIFFLFLTDLLIFQINQTTPVFELFEKREK